MNIRSVKIAFIPNEYSELVRKSHANRTAFLNIETLKTILSPSEVEFYTTLNSLGFRFEKGTLFSNVLGNDVWLERMFKPYDMPGSAGWKAKNPGLELTDRIRDRIMDTIKGTDMRQHNRQEVLNALHVGMLPLEELGLSVAYADSTCLFLTFTDYVSNRENRIYWSLKNLYEGLNKCGLFEIGVKTDAYESYDSWCQFCGNVLNSLVSYMEKRPHEAA
jgi:hypothetical protein